MLFKQIPFVCVCVCVCEDRQIGIYGSHFKGNHVLIKPLLEMTVC